MLNSVNICAAPIGGRVIASRAELTRAPFWLWVAGRCYKQRVEGFTKRAAHQTVDDEVNRACDERDDVEQIAEWQVDVHVELFAADDREQNEHAVNELAKEKEHTHDDEHECGAHILAWPFVVRPSSVY